MKQAIMSMIASLMVDLVFHSYWRFANFCKKNGKFGESLRYYYLERWCCYIGKETKFATNPILPHGFHGIHISNGVSIGMDVIIYQNVTIGSNTLKNSRHSGAPLIGNNVFIGAGAAIIGNLSIGDNCRIGANCIVVKDMPANTVAVIDNVRYIHKKENLVNEFVSWDQFKEENYDDKI